MNSKLPLLQKGTRWRSNIKGGPLECYEISVTRDDFEHGFKSFGWHDSRKIHISGSGGPCGDRVIPAVWNVLVATADALAAKFNELTETLERGEQLPEEFREQLLLE